MGLLLVRALLGTLLTVTLTHPILTLAASCNDHDNNCGDCVGAEGGETCAFALVQVTKGSSTLRAHGCHRISGKTYKKFPGNLAETFVWAYYNDECPLSLPNEVLKTTKGRSFVDIAAMDVDFSNLLHPTYGLTIDMLTNQQTFERVGMQTQKWDILGIQYFVRDVYGEFLADYKGPFYVNEEQKHNLRKLWALKDATAYCSDCAAASAKEECVATASSACRREDALLPTSSTNAEIIYAMVSTLENQILPLLDGAIKEQGWNRIKLWQERKFPFDLPKKTMPLGCQIRDKFISYNRYASLVRILERYKRYMGECAIFSESCGEEVRGPVYCRSPEKCESIPLPYWYHSSKTVDGIQSILRTKKVEEGGGTLGRGVYASTAMEMSFYGTAFYGDAGVALPSMEKRVDGSSPGGRYDRWSTFREAPSSIWAYIYFNDVKQPCASINEDLMTADHNFEIVNGFEAELERMLLRIVTMHTAGGYATMLGDKLVKGEDPHRVDSTRKPPNAASGSVPAFNPRSKTSKFFGGKLWKLQKKSYEYRARYKFWRGEIGEAVNIGRDLQKKQDERAQKLRQQRRDAVAAYKEHAAVSGGTATETGDQWCCGCMDAGGGAQGGGDVAGAIREAFAEANKI